MCVTNMIESTEDILRKTAKYPHCKLPSQTLLNPPSPAILSGRRKRGTFIRIQYGIITHNNSTCSLLNTIFAIVRQTEVPRLRRPLHRHGSI